MRIQFCGADRTVTGSCHLLEINGLRLLLDVGLYQGARDDARRLNQYLPDNAQKVDAVILSHGHLDHCGKLPVLLRAGYAGKIYCTPATAEVARIVLEDSARIQLEDAQYLNRRSREPGGQQVQALYTPSDIPPVLKAMQRVKYNQPVNLGGDGGGVSFTFHDAGHILGSAYVTLEWTEAGKLRKLLFTADVGRYDTPILRDPATLPGAFDFVITESTYGDRVHAPMAGVADQFLDAVKYCIANRSRLIIPSFAVGRTQTVLWYMQKFIEEKKIPAIPIFVDSPMATEVSHVHSAFREYYDEETSRLIGEKDLFGLSRVTFTASTQESKQINSVAGACVIIASSPTCEFGRVLHHIQVSIEREKDLIVFVGYIPPNTLGRRLQEGQRRIRIYDRWYDLKCQVKTIHGLSAHAGSDELLRFLTPTLKPESSAFVVHGDVDQSEAFAGKLLSAGIGSALVPAMESSLVELTAPPPKPTTAKPRADE